MTAVDTSEETLDLNRRRLPTGARVRYVRADVFDWQPPAAAFDVVFFGYWLSHVPEERFADFWTRVRHALRLGGRVFLVDSYHERRVSDGGCG